MKRSSRSMPSPVQAQVARLSPARDDQAIVRLCYTVEFPWDMARALELALFRTFAVPAVAELLATTGEFERRTQKRYDDTSILIGEFLAHGYDDERGRRAISRMNAIHARFAIANDTYLYVLSTFVCEPPRWLERFGWRTFSAAETEAGFRFWQRVGELMGIRAIPASYAQMDAFNRDYERRHFRHSAAGERIARATLDLMMGWYLPRPLRPLGQRALLALMDDPLLDAFGLARPAAPVRRLAERAMRVRARALRWLPRNRVETRVQDLTWRSYPDGYDIDELGARAPLSPD